MEESATELFESYELDFNQLTTSLSESLASASSVFGEERKLILRRAKDELDECDEILSQLEIEAQTSGNVGTKSTLKEKVKGYKAILVNSRIDIKKIESTSNRDDLLSTSSHPLSSTPDYENSSTTDGQSQRLLSSTQKLEDGQKRLEDSHRIALETETVGNGILNDLRGQRENLEHTRDNLYEADGGIDRASSTINKMIRRMWQQKLVTYAIIVLLVILILYVLYSKLFG